MEKITDSELVEIRLVAESATKFWPTSIEAKPSVDGTTLLVANQEVIASVTVPDSYWPAKFLSKLTPQTIVQMVDQIQQIEQERNNFEELYLAAEQKLADMNSTTTKLHQQVGRFKRETDDLREKCNILTAKFAAIAGGNIVSLATFRKSKQE